MSQITSIPSKLSKAPALLLKLSDYLMYLGLGILIIDEFLESVFSFSPLGTNDLRVSIGIGVVTLFALTLNSKVDKLQKAFERLDRKYLGVFEVLPPYETVDFRELIYHSRVVKLLTLSGTKAGFLGDSSVTDALLDPKRNSEITIILADPFAKAIIERYEKDEPSTYEAGLDGIKRRLLNLWHIINRLPSDAQSKLDVRVFSNYPTISLIQADDDLYATIYGYRLRGSDSPKIHAKCGGEYSRFLLRHFDNILQDSVPLAEWIAAHHPEASKPG
ncbi:MAG: hypothetical protein ACP5GX_08880 [Anaerolineae bacterium]